MSGSLTKIKEILLSWWLLLALVPLCGFLAFLWIGISGHKREWLKLSALYFLFCTVLPAVSAILVMLKIIEAATIGSILMASCGVALFISWLHALALRRPYLDSLRELRELNCEQ
jgi:hypothetical protein